MGKTVRMYARDPVTGRDEILERWGKIITHLKRRVVMSERSPATTQSKVIKTCRFGRRKGTQQRREENVTTGLGRQRPG